MTQDVALGILKTGANVFLTGEPGSGKTHTLNRYIDWLRERGIEPAVTASTGIAATHIGGHTIHSWSGLGIRSDITAFDLEALHEKEYLYRRITKTNVLIIEEVSMLDARVLDSVDRILRSLRRDDRPMGGMHVVFVGDFFQLPPVPARAQRAGGQKESEALFAYHSRVWQELNPVACYLTEQFRQEDTDFLEVLTALRRQDIQTEHIERLKECLPARNAQAGKTEETEEDAVTKLYAHNADVDKTNQAHLDALPGEPHTFTMERKGTKALVEQLIRGCLSPETLVLKEGAMVMFTKNNFEQGFANGTLGTVVGFADTGQPIVETRDGERIIVGPMDWSIAEDGKVKASITQLPLRLAWAITVHKSQGMSLDAAFMDLSHAFEYGQGYVALSRVRSLAGLYLSGFNDRALEVHPDVKAQNDHFLKRSQAAEQKFHNMPEDELTRKQKAFVKSLGGSWTGTGEVPRGKRQQKQATHDITGAMVKEGKGVADISEERGLKSATIFTHLEKLKQQGSITPDELAHIWAETERGEDELEVIHEKFSEHGSERLRPVYDALNESFTFDELRIARLLLSE